MRVGGHTMRRAGRAGTGGMDPVRIYDVMACDVHWDFDGSGLPREQHKFTPSRTAEPSGAVDRLTLDELGGPDAFSVFRLAEGGTLREFDTQRLVWWDNIHLDAVRSVGRTTGLDRGGVTLPVPLGPGGSCGYFVEITDGNVRRDATICVFRPHQFFTVPA
ncbi:hypothetical protein AB0H12_44080 [Actinosynnema sp. NPDC023794]